MALTWTAPGPGLWALDRSHMNQSATPITQEIMSRAATAGFRRTFKELGVPADTLQMEFVNGMTYTRLRPLVGADKPAKKLPPLPILKLLVRIHPEMRRRAKTAERTMAERPWHKVVHDWENGGRAAVETENLQLQDVDLTGLTDLELIGHVNRVIDHCIAKVELHFWLHGFDMGPIGMLLRDVKQWGLDPLEVIPLLEGASPSTSEPVRLLAGIRREVEASGHRPATFEALRAVSPKVSADLDGYLRYRGALLFSRYDLDGLTLGEVPDVILSTVMTAEERVVGDRIAAQTEVVRSRVPATNRAEFDDRLHDARDAMNLRDDNGPTTAEWPLGLLRLAMLELGRRLTRNGSAALPEHAFELQPSELKPTLLAGKGPGADELARRASERRAVDADTAPLTLGVPEPAPPMTIMPPATAKLVGTVQLVIELMGMDGAVRASGLHGSGVGTVTYRGRARRADNPEQAIERLQPGEVLVVPCTTPAYNMVLALAGAVVTAEGGPLSHAAVLARELGIPAVVGAKGALTEIPDGAEVEVDPVAGVVRVLRPGG
jgi:pyruvate,water dikinase